MGTSTDSKLLVGAPMKDFDEYFKTIEKDDDFDVYGYFRGLGLATASPYFDADSDDWVAGFEIRNNIPRELLGTLHGELAIKFDRFEDLFGFKPMLMHTPDVY